MWKLRPALCNVYISILKYSIPLTHSQKFPFSYLNKYKLRGANFKCTVLHLKIRVYFHTISHASCECNWKLLIYLWQAKSGTSHSTLPLCERKSVRFFRHGCYNSEGNWCVTAVKRRPFGSGNSLKISVDEKWRDFKVF